MFTSFLVFYEAVNSGITQELKSAIKCWCYGQHQHGNNSCNGNVPHGLTLSQHTDELCEFSVPVRSGVARYFAPCTLSEDSVVATAVGLFRARACCDGRLSGA